MPRYACREDNGQLKIPPAGRGREAFCGECLNGPCKGENCLFGHSAETRLLIKCISLEQRHAAAHDHALRIDHCCALCGLPLRGHPDGDMHRECWAKVMSRERTYTQQGKLVGRDKVMQELQDEGVPYPI